MDQSSALPSTRGIMFAGNWKILKVTSGRWSWATAWSVSATIVANATISTRAVFISNPPREFRPVESAPQFSPRSTIIANSAPDGRGQPPSSTQEPGEAQGHDSGEDETDLRGEPAVDHHRRE